MTSVDHLIKQREAALLATQAGPPARTSNPFFGVGPITNMTADEVERRLWRFEFEAWLETNYRKIDDSGNDIGPITPGELDRGMHRGYPADKVVLDMMREIHSYFGFPKANRMAVGLGGGHTGFSVCVMHLMNANKDQHVFVDSPRPETEAASSGGFFRQSWATQLLELQQFAPQGDVNRIHFSEKEGCIVSASELEALGVSLFIGVGHETTGATTYCEEDIRELLTWLSKDPLNRHAVIDGTSMLGAMPWDDNLVQELTKKCCIFMPLQKAIGGVAGYFVASFTMQALALIEDNLSNAAWAIPRQMKLAVPTNAKQPLSSSKTTELGPFYDPLNDTMLGGIINTFSTLAFAETTFALRKMQEKVGSVSNMNQRSKANRQRINDWVAQHPLFELGVSGKAYRGAAVTLLKVNDPEINDPALHVRIIMAAKKLLSFDGLKHASGEHETGLDVARYINAFPGTPGDFRAWIGGARTEADITALLDNLEYAYHRAKIVVLEEELAKEGVTFEARASSHHLVRKDDPKKAYKVLIADALGLKFTADGHQDVSEVKAFVEAQGGVWHEGGIRDEASLEQGKIHFFNQPNLSTEAELLPLTHKGQYDAVIAAATFLPEASIFAEGGVRIGAGTGNMRSSSWGGGNGEGGTSPLMNTPSFNSRATAHMVIKALLKVAPNLPVNTLHERVVSGSFDTGQHLRDFPTEKLEGKRIALLGYGNIGREVAKIAKALSMNVVIYARAKHQAWIESEGFVYAASVKEAATGADVISPHLGLGSLDANTGKYANANLIDDMVFAVMNSNAIVINYDRGELIDAAALDKALESGKVRYASIDADIFTSDSGELTGPMQPYLAVEQKHKGKLELLPHAAADTEHISRVEGAKQALKQIINAIRYKHLSNLKGDLPEGYINTGAKTVKGVGKVNVESLAKLTQNAQLMKTLRTTSERLAGIWAALDSVKDNEQQAELLERHATQLILDSNTYASLVESLGLQGPYDA